MSDDKLLTQEKIAKAYQIPYWLVTLQPRPSWVRRPVWRFRALWWRWFAK